MTGHKMLEHTADVGVEVWAPSLPELFSEAARAMLAIIVEEGDVLPSESRTVELEGEDLPDLLVGWLSELLVLLETEGLLFSRFRFDRLDDRRLAATLEGERLQPDRHGLGREVKAATFHELEVAQDSDGRWRARIIFDL